MFIAVKIFGVVGLIIIAISVLVKNEKRQDWLFILGGACLLVYSSYLRDFIFIILQIVFILVAAAELIKLSRRRGFWKRLRDKISM